MAGRRICILLFVSGMLVPAAMAGDDNPARYFRSFEVPEGTTLPDAVCIGCSVIANGTVDGDAVAIAGDIVIRGSVRGDAVAVGGRVVIEPGASLEGDAVAIGGIVIRPPDSHPATEDDVIPYFHLPGQRSFHSTGVGVFVGANGLLVLLGALLLRRRSDRIAGAVTIYPVLTVALGLLLMVLWYASWIAVESKPAAAVVAGWVGQAFMTALVFSGCIGLVWLVGDKSLREGRRALKWVVGAAIWLAVLLIPVVGSAALLLVLVGAPGAALQSGFGTSPDWFRRTILRLR